MVVWSYLVDISRRADEVVDGEDGNLYHRHARQTEAHAGGPGRVRIVAVRQHLELHHAKYTNTLKHKFSFSVSMKTQTHLDNNSIQERV